MLDVISNAACTPGRADNFCGKRHNQCKAVAQPVLKDTA